MAFYYIVLVAVVQGITEFLPISSSAHLILLSKFFQQAEHGIEIDISVHFGTLVAICLYFKKDVLTLINGFKQNISGNYHNHNAQFFRLILVATIPILLVGFIVFLTDMISALRSLKVIGWSTVLFGLLLYLSDKYGKSCRAKRLWNIKDALIMGCWQAIAIIPGSSRSGTTITGARFLGFSRWDGTELSMLMSIPTILASGCLLVYNLTMFEADLSGIKILLTSFLCSFIVALISLVFLFRFIRNYNFSLFAVYRIIVGSGILFLAYN